MKNIMINITKKDNENILRKLSFFFDIKYEIIAGRPSWNIVKPKCSPSKKALLKKKY
ncbi:MAG: hypothetical protein R3B65_02010 [Candidatus Paceibacterota bacterium]